MRYFKPQQPDPFIKKPSDMTPAKFGHLNHLINLIGSVGGVTLFATNGANLPAVPGAFADNAAVQSYLASVIPAIEARLDALEAKVNAVITASANSTGADVVPGEI